MSRPLTDDEVKRFATELHRTGSNARGNVDMLRDGILEFIAQGHWRSFRSSKTMSLFTYDSFDKFCEQWLCITSIKLQNLFTDEPEVSGIVEKLRVAENPLREVGAPVGNDNASKADKENKVDNSNIVSKSEASKNDRTYTLRRLARDRHNQHTPEEDRKGSNTTIPKEEPKGGTSRTYTLRRLARDRPDLLDKVEAGELSANAAAIEAGFRSPPKKGLDRVKELINKLSSTEFAELVAWINEEIQ